MNTGGNVCLLVALRPLVGAWESSRSWQWKLSGKIRHLIYIKFFEMMYPKIGMSDVTTIAYIVAHRKLNVNKGTV